MFQSIHRIKKLKAAVIIDEVATWGGGTTPILNLIRPFQFNENGFKIIILKNRLGFFKALFVFIFQRNIIVNGFDPLNYLFIIFLCLIKKNVLIYPQTIQYQLDSMKTNSFKFRLLKIILKNKKIACVSGLQKEYFINEFGSKNIKLVHGLAIKEPIIPRDAINICMIGYYSELKGVNFYSNLSDRAKSLGLNLRFFWLGDGPLDSLVFSDNVSWLGYSANPKYILSKMDLFFLSSREESIPLVILEALEMNIKCVAYKNTGVADYLRSINGCAIYDLYTEESALIAIQKAVISDLKTSDVTELLDKYTNREKIYQKFNSFLIE